MLRILAFVLCLGLATIQARAAEETPVVSIIANPQAGSPAAYGIEKIAAALRAKQIAFETAESPQTARGRALVLAGLSSGDGAAADLLKSANVPAPRTPESLVIRNTTLAGKPALLIAGADDRGLMYAELDVAERIAWSTDAARPFEHVRDIAESPAVTERAISIYTMNRAYWESRFYDGAYWDRYLATLAANRFNTLVIIFGYENGGFLAPPYPYFFATEGFPDIHMVGITAEQQKKNLDTLNSLIDRAHGRGVHVTLGIWDHIYRGGVQGGGIPNANDALRNPTPHLVWGVNEKNLIPYTKAALAQFVRAVPRVDALQFRMHDESGLKNSEQVSFWQSVFAMMKQQAPGLRLDLRAKGLPDSVIDAAIETGVPFRITTKYWMEQMGLPFHPTHINPPNQKDRRHSYADMLRYPQRYAMHWRLWNGGTSRLLLWGDPEFARRFAESTRLYDGDGFEVNEPLCTKMEAQPHDAKPFDILAPQYRYTDYEFERYWHFFQSFGRIGYNPRTPADVFDHEFVRRFGPDAAPSVSAALHRASWILPRIVASSYPYSHFPMTRGWPEKQSLGDLPRFAKAEGTDVAIFAGFDEEAQTLLEGRELAKVRPGQTARWFADASKEINTQIAEAEKRIGDRRSKEFDSSAVDLKILSNLALYHSRRIPAAVAYCIYKRSGDPAALEQAITHEAAALDAWKQLVAAAGDVYAPDLMFGVRGSDLCGHWRDELPTLEKSLTALQRQRAEAGTAANTPATQALQAFAAALAVSPGFPQVQHAPIAAAAANQPITVRVTARSAAGIKWVRLRYRGVNQTLDYDALPLLAAGKPDEYQGTVPAGKIDPKWDFMYYIEVMDNKGAGAIFPDQEIQEPYFVVRLQRG
ncbi:MAG: hypothetical protein ABSH20_05180 [Tepidisphaeraceae bacterium]|jgi:hypothetical protein